MKPLPAGRERVIGWILAALAALHVLALLPLGATPSQVASPIADLLGLGSLALLVAGATLRGLRLQAPRGVGYLLLPLGLVAVAMGWGRAGDTAALPPLIGALADFVASIPLLRPLTAARCQQVIFCLVLVLVATILTSASGAGQTLIVIDVAAMYLLLEEAFRPPDALISFWVSLVRSFRVIVPVVLAVMVLFWVFPNVFTPSSGSEGITGFAGGDTADARSIAELSQSSRIAFTARFAPGEPIPSPTHLYWRGQVMEANDGFQWSVADRRQRGAERLAPIGAAPAPSAQLTHYAQEIAENRGLLPLLDHAISAKATSQGQPIAVISHGAGTLSSGGLGALALKVASSAAPLTDAPQAEIQDGCRQVPAAILGSTPIQAIVQRIFQPTTDLPSQLQALSRYFTDAGFQYTTQPGPTPDLAQFLTAQRAGFCSHYAMAAANLLRLAGVPTRVVTGYRGGEWNPWLRTITVRDSDAHAWVEAWDEKGHDWLRFDPTDAVAPELRAAIASEMDAATWPWYRRAPGYAGYLVTATGDAMQHALDRLTSGKFRDRALIAIALALAGLGFVWGLRASRRRRRVDPREKLARLLLHLEDRAEGPRARNAGETALAWLNRLAQLTSLPEERTVLAQIADAYESGMYRPDPPDRTGLLRQNVPRLLKLWKTQRSPSQASAKSGN